MPTAPWEPPARQSQTGLGVGAEGDRGKRNGRRRHAGGRAPRTTNDQRAAKTAIYLHVIQHPEAEFNHLQATSPSRAAWFSIAAISAALGRLTRMATFLWYGVLAIGSQSSQSVIRFSRGPTVTGPPGVS